MEKIAIFDFDKTLTVKDTTVIIANYFVAKSGRYLYYINFIFWGILYKLGLISNRSAKNEMLKILKGLTREKIYKEVEKLYSERIVPVLREDVVAKIGYYKSRGYKTVLLSAQFDFIVKEVFKQLKFDTYIATRTDLDALQVNGDVLEGREKAEAIKLLFSDVDYNNSVAFADNRKKDIYLGGVVSNVVWIK